MSNHSKSRNNAKYKIKKTESASMALAALGGNAKRIEQLEKAAIKRKHPSTVRLDLPGTVRGEKASKLKNGEDSPSKNRLEKEVKLSDKVKAQGKKSKGKVKVAPIQETVVISDSKASPKSEKLTKAFQKNKTKAPPVQEASKIKGPSEAFQKNNTKAPPIKEVKKYRDPSKAFKKSKTKAPPIKEASKAKGLSDRKREKTKASPNEASKVNGPDIDKDPNDSIDEARSESLTVSSHASIHALQLVILTLEDSMRWTTVIEALLNVELQKLGRSSCPISTYRKGPNLVETILCHFLECEESSWGSGTLRRMEEDDDEEDSFQGCRMTKDDDEEKEEEDSSRGHTTSGVTEDDDKYDEDDD
ncbi:hypothetical protein ARMGADRAFT_1026061 [Armillaria gallica]|uniref:Uncharacterized protein n=1 Tax=Armillaria gallica TaxID=47427 RepID=A0A2H3E1E0_ARMGA|nr:hypothetical protein ARMGADRAFT_1026061 [Armillaria gallica]